MNQIYAGYIKDYKGKEFGGINKVASALFIEDKYFFLNWKWSEKKNKYYSKIEESIGDKRYMFIVLKTGFILIFDMGKSNVKADGVRDFYHIIQDGEVEKIVPDFNIPF